MLASSQQFPKLKTQTKKQQSPQTNTQRQCYLGISVQITVNEVETSTITSLLLKFNNLN